MGTTSIFVLTRSSLLFRCWWYCVSATLVLPFLVPTLIRVGAFAMRLTELMQPTTFPSYARVIAARAFVFAPPIHNRDCECGCAPATLGWKGMVRGRRRQLVCPAEQWVGAQPTPSRTVWHLWSQRLSPASTRNCTLLKPAALKLRLPGLSQASNQFRKLLTRWCVRYSEDRVSYTEPDEEKLRNRGIQYLYSTVLYWHPQWGGGRGEYSITLVTPLSRNT
jgi:hypothetical protein